MDWPLPLWRVLREELGAFDKPTSPLPTEPFDYSPRSRDPLEHAPNAPEEIDDLSLLATQIAASKSELTKLHKDAEFAALIAQLDREKAAPNGHTRQTAFEVLNRLLETPKLGNAFLNVPIAWAVLEQERKAEQEKKSLEKQQRKEMNRDLLDYVFAGGVRPVSDKLMPGVVDDLHRAQLSALCFSGGGIRSATFCLGALQGLAKKGLLDKFHYLSTVSGGGFLGGWLAAWTYWSKGDLSKVISQLNNPTLSKLEPEPDPVFYLRNFSNYLTPRTGLLSADTWTLGATYMRNLLLNWVVLLPLLMALLAVPYPMLVLLHPVGTLIDTSRHYAVRWLCLAPAGLGFACAMFYQGIARPSHLERLQYISVTSCWSRWWLHHRSQGSVVVLSLLPLLFSAYVFSTCAYHSFLFRPGSFCELGIFLAFGAISVLLGWGAYALSLRGWYLCDLAAMFFSALVGMGLFYLILKGWGWFDSHLQTDRALYLCLPTPLVLIVFLLAATVFVGLATFWTDDEDREFWARMGAWILAGSFAWGALGAVSLFGPEIFTQQKLWSKLLTYGGSLLVSLVTASLGFSSKTPARIDDKSVPPSSMALQRALPILGAISIVLILAALAVVARMLVGGMTHLAARLVSSLGRYCFGLNHAVPMLGAASAIIAAGAVGLLTSYFVDPNKYSLHSMYRNRLIRAYLGASRKKGERHPNPFTGFDPDDNIPMKCLWPKTPRKLMPFINMTLNMVEPVSRKLSWQERKAESFTVTPLHSGSLWVGYRDSKDYACGSSWRKTTPITLGTATAISGAAVSPDMGYNSSPIVSMLLTLFNARLGWWLGNPGIAGNDTYRFSNPGGRGPQYMIDEALGRTNDEKPYVYLSDGGHFENLGLYEMVLRRCHTIVVIDAGQDAKLAFADLGNAIRKIRIDLGISIEFSKFSNFRKFNDGAPTLYCSVGKIRYSPEDRNADGILIYIKPTIRGDESADILNYERQHTDFPHESTAEQWFSESQFESYRALGEFEIEQILESPKLFQPDPYKEAREILSKLT